MKPVYKRNITKHLWSLPIVAILLFGCQQNTTPLIDKNATPETRHLYAKLFQLQGKKILFGHQDDLAYGVNWRYEPGRSDVKEIVGDYPAVMGWDIGHIEHGREANLDAVPFSLMKEFIISSAKKGSINTISWHLDNPATGGSSWDTTAAVAHILPTGHLHTKFVGWLDQVAAFLDDLRFEDGTPVPILFRPFHELNGNWFWWCKPFCTQEDYIALWQFTVQYLKDVKGLHHLIYVYNTNNFVEEADFMDRYPGDDYVDMMSFDTYQLLDIEGMTPETLQASSEQFKSHLQANLDVLQRYAHQHGKLMALAETGFEAIPSADWWTTVLYDAIAPYDISYVLLWRNQGELDGKMHYYAPYPGHISETDFKKFFQGTKMALQSTLDSLNIYNRTQ